MKLLLLLPMFIFLMACGEVEEEPSETTTMVNEALDVFVINKEMLEDEVMFGVLCLATLKDTGSKRNDMCDLYYLTQEQAIAMSAVGLDIFTALVNSGILAESEDNFFEVIDIVERLAKVQKTAKKLRKEIDTTSGSGCIKCAM